MSVEFDCAECGRHIIAVALARVPAPPLCAHCLHIPGWFRDADLRRMLDAEHDGLDAMDRVTPRPIDYSHLVTACHTEQQRAELALLFGAAAVGDALNTPQSPRERAHQLARMMGYRAAINAIAHAMGRPAL
jgi:hypothetical protein